MLIQYTNEYDYSHHTINVLERLLGDYNHSTTDMLLLDQGEFF